MNDPEQGLALALIGKTRTIYENQYCTFTHLWCFHHIKNYHMIRVGNQQIGFYMMRTMG